MKKKEKSSKETLQSIQKELSSLIAKQKDLIKRKNELERDIFKYETDFLETGQGYPVTNTLDHYLGQRQEKKKYTVKTSDRIFSTLLPRIYRYN